MGHEKLIGGKYYHIYNRGINGCNLFIDPIEYEQFLELYNKFILPIADTYAWVLMPNHFHIVVSIKENLVYKYSGINPEKPDNTVPFKDKSWYETHKWETIELPLSEFKKLPENPNIKRPVPYRHFGHLFNAYTSYFNPRRERTGSLFERPYKRKSITNSNQLKKVIQYVHNNPVHHGFCEHPLEYPWSSYLTCISEKPTNLKRDAVINLFGNKKENLSLNQQTKSYRVAMEKWLGLKTIDHVLEAENEIIRS